LNHGEIIDECPSTVPQCGMERPRQTSTPPATSTAVWNTTRSSRVAAIWVGLSSQPIAAMVSEDYR